MARIPQAELITLIPASNAKTVADGAIADLEEMQVASCINNAANAGNHFCIYQHKLSADMITKLEDMGYTVTPKVCAAVPDDQYIIGGF